MRPLPLKEKEYRLGLLSTEKRAIIPIKWCVLAVTLALWFTLAKPESTTAAQRVVIYALFAIYTTFNLLETWLFCFGRVGIDRIKPVTLISYLVDVIFVSVLIYLELAPSTPTQTPYGNFYILYFLLVMRGFALFKAVIETILVNALISVLFILTIWVQQANFQFITDPRFAVQLVLIWVVVLMAWFIMVVLNQQKMDIIRVNERLMRAESLARVGELAAGVAHEINNPLGVIIASTEYIKKKAGPDGPYAEEIEAIHQESNRCKDIVRHMLDYANPKPAEPALLNAPEINDEVLGFIFPKGQAGEIELVKEYGPSPPAFKADPNLIKQALLNIYLNAKQAIPAGRPGRIVSRIRAGFHARAVIFEIEDNGVGVAPEDLEHVFDPFFSRREEGSGLGLAITQKIVESAGGSIALDPLDPCGTRVSLEFPAIPEAG